MAVSRGSALAWSAALHVLGVGAASWATHGRLPEAAVPVALTTARAYAIHYLLPVAPPRRTEPARRPAPASPRPQAPPPSREPSTSPVKRYGNQPMRAPARLEVRRTEAMAPVQVQELPPGSATGVTLFAPPEAEAMPATLAGGGVDRAASLVAPVGSACPDLAAPREGSGRELAIAVAVVVDAAGRVDPAHVRVVEGPGQSPSSREFYPRIYVVGMKGRAGETGAERWDHGSMADAVARHVAGLRFRPALAGGRAVSSTVLIACHLTD